MTTATTGPPVAYWWDIVRYADYRNCHWCSVGREYGDHSVDAAGVRTRRSVGMGRSADCPEPCVALCLRAETFGRSSHFGTPERVGPITDAAGPRL